MTDRIANIPDFRVTLGDTDLTDKLRPRLIGKVAQVVFLIQESLVRVWIGRGPERRDQILPSEGIELARIDSR
mgnify:CR=1 FL=1